MTGRVTKGVRGWGELSINTFGMKEKVQHCNGPYVGEQLIIVL